MFDKRNPAHLYLNLLSANSANTMERALDAIVKLLGYDYMDELDWTELQRHHVQGLLRLLESNNTSPATRSLYLSAIKGVMEEAWLAKLVSEDQDLRIKVIKKPHGTRLPAGEALPIADVGKAIVACGDNSKAGVRDKAILALLLGAGLRRLECAELGLRDVDFGQDVINVIGKGDKQRSIPVSPKSSTAYLIGFTYGANGWARFFVPSAGANPLPRVNSLAAISIRAVACLTRPFT
ncbi:tyrosine recombinase XerC [Paraglaciecola sp. MB-3u-78]|uniref:site-specific integrase n=1 Tax=Paraglaciecola sp. MB-3u-78 TaxID=2058332 RepID=UPI0012FF1B9F|nr:tyrosine-type recombinase/integrase [Paraglaciecola sp. MB-3u-78]